ncbi:MAG TPA: acyltransferase [Methylocella sp.]|jgi:peptidoglycan/LPS O-acetylase OafA/YrhL
MGAANECGAYNSDWMTLADRLKATNDRPSGFDYLRLGLATSVIFFHSGTVTYGNDFGLWEPPLGAFLRAILPMFFVLSGFLVAGSLERSKTLFTFLGLRAIRIYPALAVEVVLSAFLIGATVTALPLAEYFRDSQFWRYLLNMFGDIHYNLPGVFTNNPYAGVVNAQLWTVPVEFLCYAALAALVALGSVQRKFLIPLAALGLAVAHLILRAQMYHWHLPTFGPFSDSLLLVSFLCGVSAYLYRDKIVWSLPMFTGALIASIVFLWFVPLGAYPAIVTLTYVTIYFGLTNFKRYWLIRGADYSYGMYLYGSVVLQLFVWLAAPRFWWISALVCVPASALLAAFSWHFIEKPAQSTRKHLAVGEKHYLALKNRLLGHPITAVFKGSRLIERE